MVDNVIILAGGSGTRLWPISTLDKPKQFLDPGLGKPLLHATIERATMLTSNIYIVTHHTHIAETTTLCSKLDTSIQEKIKVIAEPMSKNTAPAIAYALSAMKQSSDRPFPDQSTLVLSADHIILDIEEFTRDIETGVRIAQQGYIVTFGVTPKSPHTGYGYIEQGKTIEHDGISAYQVSNFQEKPSITTTHQFFYSGHHYWNAGIFMFHNRSMTAQLKEYAPGIAHILDIEKLHFTAEQRIAVAHPPENVADVYRTIDSISIDYAVLEHSDLTAVVPVHFQWSDVGNWDEIAELHKNKNTDTASIAQIQANNNFIHSDGGHAIALCGVDDLIVVAQKNKILICRRGNSEQVKNIVQYAVYKDKG